MHLDFYYDVYSYKYTIISAIVHRSTLEENDKLLIKTDLVLKEGSNPLEIQCKTPQLSDGLYSQPSLIKNDGYTYPSITEITLKQENTKIVELNSDEREIMATAPSLNITECESNH